MFDGSGVVDRDGGAILEPGRGRKSAVGRENLDSWRARRWSVVAQERIKGGNHQFGI
jgi:hypothetical protein